MKDCRPPKPLGLEREDSTAHLTPISKLSDGLERRKPHLGLFPKYRKSRPPCPPSSCPPDVLSADFKVLFCPSRLENVLWASSDSLQCPPGPRSPGRVSVVELVLHILECPFFSPMQGREVCSLCFIVLPFLPLSCQCPPISIPAGMSGPPGHLLWTKHLLVAGTSSRLCALFISLAGQHCPPEMRSSERHVAHSHLPTTPSFWQKKWRLIVL